MGDRNKRKIEEHQVTPTSNIVFSASNNIRKQDGPNDVPFTAYKVVSQSIPSTQFSKIGNSIIKSGIPTLRAQEICDNVRICPFILHHTKQSSSQVQMKNDSLIKAIEFSPRSQLTALQQSCIVSSSLQRSTMESPHNVQPLMITPIPPVIHTTRDTVPAKIVPIPSSAPITHFSVIKKTATFDYLPDYATTRRTMVSSTPTMSDTSPLYTQSDFARFSKNYHYKSAPVNLAVIRAPKSGYIKNQSLNIPNSQHVFRPIITPRPNILRKRDVDGTQRNLLPTLQKSEMENFQKLDDSTFDRHGYRNSGGLQIQSNILPQIHEIILPQISALTKQSHLMVEMSPRKTPRKQILPVNQDNQDTPLKIICNKIEYVNERYEKTEEFPVDCIADFNDGDIEDEGDDVFDENDLLDDDIGDEDIDDDDIDDDDIDNDDIDDDDDDEVFYGNDDDDDDDDDIQDVFDSAKYDKISSDEMKASGDLSDKSSTVVEFRNIRPTLLENTKNTRRGHSHHFEKYTDFKIKESKKQLVEMQQTKKWMPNSTSGWKVKLMIKHFDELVEIEKTNIQFMTTLITSIEKGVNDPIQRSTLIELSKCHIQRNKVNVEQLNKNIQKLNMIFEYKSSIEELVEKYCPKEFKKKCMESFNRI